MHRYTLTVPTHDNTGDDLDIVHAGVSRKLAREFDGFTVLTGEGAWHAVGALNPGREAVKDYVIDTSHDGALETLTRLARSIRRVAGQDAVYLTRQTVETWLVGPDPAPAFEAVGYYVACPA